MIHFVLATDYDGTLAHHGHVDEPTIEALTRFRKSGRKLVLVTGRRMESLLEVFSRTDLFECVVAENGATLYWPDQETEEPLAASPSPAFLRALADRNVSPVEVGRVIVATWTPHENAVLDAIHEMALELQIIFNKGAVMVLPTGINKAFGLQAALRKLGFSSKNAVAIGDAENDLSLLSHCGVSAAVANALPVVKDGADIVLREDHGAGVRELIEEILRNDLQQIVSLPRRGVPYGTSLRGEPLLVPAFGESLVVIGGPGGGKSTFAISFWERVAEQGFQTCVIDPEGDFQIAKGAISVGSSRQPPSIEEVIQVLTETEQDCVVSLFSVPKDERPHFFVKLAHALIELRNRTGRPHWLIVDEAHYLVPANWEPAVDLNLEKLSGTVYISAFPERLSQSAFTSSGLIVTISDEPVKSLEQCFELLGQPALPIPEPDDQREHRAIVWDRRSGSLTWFRRIQPASDACRHKHEYFDGELGEKHHFRFRGPQNRLDLRAYNFRLFIQMALGVDEETWLHHLQLGDYSTWVRNVIEDQHLADELEQIERSDLSANESRELVISKIRERYESPAPQD